MRIKQKIHKPANQNHQNTIIKPELFLHSHCIPSENFANKDCVTYWAIQTRKGKEKKKLKIPLVTRKERARRGRKNRRRGGEGAVEEHPPWRSCGPGFHVDWNRGFCSWTREKRKWSRGAINIAASVTSNCSHWYAASHFYLLACLLSFRVPSGQSY